MMMHFLFQLVIQGKIAHKRSYRRRKNTFKLELYLSIFMKRWLSNEIFSFMMNSPYLIHSRIKSGEFLSNTKYFTIVYFRMYDIDF